jgi:hypothetical protein
MKAGRSDSLKDNLNYAAGIRACPPKVQTRPDGGAYENGPA